ncbi:MAG: hypothetical protein JWP01_1274 [Myxococcales bacterium]|nr:hypothetical protein [Myxococcales bacterium]
MVRSLLLAVIMITSACVTADEAAPDDSELAELDAWATTSDGKADLPNTWTELVAWLTDFYTNQMSAIWRNQEHPATPASALGRIRTMVTQAGRNPATTKFAARIQRLDAGHIDHSEIDITLPGGTIVRLVGDPKGAGVFFDGALFEDSVGPQLCLTWSELETAITASYVSGLYGTDFVCHTVTERVLRALEVGTATISSQFRTYQSARWIWGPQLPSWSSQNPASWAVSRSCQ